MTAVAEAIDLDAPPLVTLKADHQHGYVVRAYRWGSFRGYTIVTQHGWTVVAPVKGQRGVEMRTVDRYDWRPGTPPWVTRASAVAALMRYAAAGSTEGAA